MNKFNKEQKIIFAGVVLSLILGIITIIIGLDSGVATVVTLGVLMVAFFCMMIPGIIYKIFENKGDKQK